MIDNWSRITCVPSPSRMRMIIVSNRMTEHSIRQSMMFTVPAAPRRFTELFGASAPGLRGHGNKKRDRKSYDITWSWSRSRLRGYMPLKGLLHNSIEN